MKAILLIDDHPLIRQNTSELLQLAGYTVQTAENGKAGVEYALATRPDLVICDVMMPVLDGYGVLQIFNQHPQLTGIPFIFLTAKATPLDLRQGMELGADDYLTKPFNSNTLLSTVARRLARFQYLRPPAAPTGSLESLTANRRAHQIVRGQCVYTAGNKPSRLYYVQAGQVKAIRAAPGGKEMIVALYQEGDFFGYEALLTQTRYESSTVAVKDCSLLYIPAEEVQSLLHGAELGRQLATLLATRLREREQQLLETAYCSLRHRVAAALLRLHNPHNALIQLSREELAEVVGTTTESLSRLLSEFKQDGLVELTPKGIRLLQPEKLNETRW
jgi:CheY-like chemotaxis protein